MAIAAESLSPAGLPSAAVWVAASVAAAFETSVIAAAVLPLPPLPSAMPPENCPPYLVDGPSGREGQEGRNKRRHCDKRWRRR